MARPRVLIVDDEPPILQLLQLVLEDRDWHIEVVTSGETALRRHKSEPFDLIVTDKNLPDIDGVRIIEEIRKYDRKVRFVMITGFGSLDSAVAVSSLDIDSYLEKPFDDVILVGDILAKALVRRRRMTFELQSQTGQEQEQNETPLSILVAGATSSLRLETEKTLGRYGDSFAFCGTVHQIEAKLLPKSEADVLILCTALASTELLRPLRKRLPLFPVAVISEYLDLPTTRELIELKINLLINNTLSSHEVSHKLSRLMETIRLLKQARLAR